MVERGVQRVGAPRADEVAAERPLIARQIVDVGVERLRGLDARRVVDPHAGAQVTGQHLVGAAADLVIAARRLRVLDAAVRDVGHFVLIEEVGAEAAVGPAAPVIAVLAADTLTGLREPVVHQRRVLAAIDRPEEGVVKRLAAQRRGSVGGNQEAGGAVAALGRVVHDRQVEHWHALDRHHRVLEQRVVVDVEVHHTGLHVPAGRRLHTGAEAAVRDLVFLRADLLDRLAEEVDNRVLAGHRRRRDRPGSHRLALLRHGHDAARVVERPEPCLGVEFGTLRGNAVRALRQHDVAGQDGAILVVEEFDEVGVDVRLVLRVVDFDVALPDVVLLAEDHQRVARLFRLLRCGLLRPGRRRRSGQRRLRRLRGRRPDDEQHRERAPDETRHGHQCKPSVCITSPSRKIDPATTMRGEVRHAASSAAGSDGSIAMDISGERR